MSRNNPDIIDLVLIGILIYLLFPFAWGIFFGSPIIEYNPPTGSSGGVGFHWQQPKSSQSFIPVTPLIITRIDVRMSDGYWIDDVNAHSERIYSISKIYQATGTFGIDARPTGNPIATSKPREIQHCGWDVFVTFTYDTPVTLQAGQVYCFTVETYGTWTTEPPYTGFQIRMNSEAIYGNMMTFSSTSNSWWGNGLWAIPFKIYGNPT